MIRRWKGCKLVLIDDLDNLQFCVRNQHRSSHGVVWHELDGAISPAFVGMVINFVDYLMTITFRISIKFVIQIRV